MKGTKFIMTLALVGTLASCGGGETTTTETEKPTTEQSTTTMETTKHTEHEFELLEHIDPTLESQGYDLYKCKDCEITEKRNYTGVFGDKELDYDKTYSVLFIGNSYTFFNNSWTTFANIADAYGIYVETDEVTAPGYKLSQMANPYDSYGKKVHQKLEENEYDIVFLQENSLGPITGLGNFFDAVRDLHRLVEDNGARDVLYETWGRRSDSPDLEKYNLTNDTMTQRLMAAYVAIGKECGIPVSHVGQAFFEIYSTHPEISIYNADMYHPSPIGSYVIALTHFCTVFGLSPIGTEFKYYKKEEDAEKQAIIEKAVYNAVFGKSILREEFIIESEGFGKY